MTKAAQVSSDVAARECDVLIIGAGMAGSCLARQLKLRIPELESANETASASPIRELVEFCAHIPLVYTPCAEDERSITA